MDWAPFLNPGDGPPTLAEMLAGRRPEWMGQAACRDHGELDWVPPADDRAVLINSKALMPF
jgi:hypothetical protein